ncbi:hypothetical protein NLJ89_g11959 [Agrocybe chaxingu]|uniref:SnoaL-like domain-containing protein n=1 Tax=Agrocybe chaxingu TaxID=84603 RepID=A0A9W8JRF9_9AGAR|nr:hypothetical protein NLJ89_g11959 [Agrocybe chaxingu]
MRFTNIFAAAVAVAALHHVNVRGQVLNETPATDRVQLRALTEFANTLFVEKDAQKAYDEWVPGVYINHTPEVLSGRENSLAAIEALFSNLNLGFTIAAVVVVGDGLGYIHHRTTVPGEFDWAVIDLFRFNGTCMVEHWDVIQPITGNEINPIAFF